MYLRATLLFALLVYCSGLELQSEESTLPKQLSAVVPQGKRLKLTVENVYYPAHRWRFNGIAVSEKCDIAFTNGSSTLICPNMDRSDEGLYEYQAITENGQKEILLAVSVKVAECTDQLAAKQQAEQLEDSSIQASDPCFCSGITDKCRLATDLYRSQVTANMTEADMVELKISTEKVEESWNVDSAQESWTYYSLPRELRGNLLNSYGGYFDFPSNDDGIDEDGPDIVLQGKHYCLVHHNRRELLSNEFSRSRIMMTEENWRMLNGSTVSRHVFMSVLTNVRAFYVKCYQYRKLEPVEMVLDSAGLDDQGLGSVDTVEECDCRTGYSGLSCESCARGYYRRHAIGVQGVCVSFREKWNSLRESLSWKHRLERMGFEMV